MLAVTFFDWLSKLDDDVFKVGMIFTALSAAGIAWAIAWAWRGVRKSEHRVRLTALLVERGYAREEIAMLLNAALGPQTEAGETPETTADPEVRMVRYLSEQSYDGDDVERVLAAARIDGKIDPKTVAIVKTMAENWVDAGEIARVLEARRQRHVQHTQDGGSRPVAVA